MAAQTLVAVEEQLGRSLPLAAFFRTDATDRRARGAARRRRRRRSTAAADGRHELVIELRAGDAPGLFCDPSRRSRRCSYGVGGCPGSIFPSGVRTPAADASDADSTATSSVEQLSEALLEPLLAVQPHGPFYLEGYSFGGLLAYELAAAPS